MATLEALIAAGQAARRDGRGGEAAALLEEAVRRHPTAAEPAFARCIVALERADAAATRHLADLLVRFPAHAAGWEDLGAWLLRAGKPEAALACLRRAASVAPTGRLALACGDALRSLGRSADARAAYAEAIRLDPRSARAAFLLALSADEAGDLAAARDGYEQALAIEPGLPEAWMNLGAVLQRAGDLAGAKRAYAAAVQRRADTFGRVSQALSASPRGELWLDLGRLRRSLAG